MMKNFSFNYYSLTDHKKIDEFMNLSHDYYFARKISSAWYSWKGNFEKRSIALYDEEETIHLLNATIY